MNSPKNINNLFRGVEDIRADAHKAVYEAIDDASYLKAVGVLNGNITPGANQLSFAISAVVKVATCAAALDQILDVLDGAIDPTSHLRILRDLRVAIHNDSDRISATTYHCLKALERP